MPLRTKAYAAPQGPIVHYPTSSKKIVLKAIMTIMLYTNFNVDQFGMH